MIYFVNDDKLARAKEILELQTRSPKDDGEADRKSRWAAHLAQMPKDADPVRYVYEKLGGLVRTEEEEREHKKKVEVIRKKKRVE